MAHFCNPLALSSVFAIAVACVPLPALAQVTGDGTLGTLVNGAPTAPCTGFCLVTDGATRGSNLFHSFRQFSLPNGDFAGFVTTPTIQNVIVRVTGQGSGFISNINGTIATTDPTVTNVIPTNFFLLNPNGVVFGPNARILVGRSFLATTAERMQFQDGAFFSTRDPVPLLTISVPIGLQFGSSPRNIDVNGSRIFNFFQRLSNFALVGGNVVLDDVQVSSDRVDIVGVDAFETVEMILAPSNKLSFNFSGTSPQGNVILTNSTSISGREIVINAGNIRILQKSFLDTGSTTDTTKIFINLNAAESIEIAGKSIVGDPGQPPPPGFATFPSSSGGVFINANALVVDDAQIGTDVSSRIKAGDIVIRTNTIDLSNGGGIRTRVNQAEGEGGKIDLQTNVLRIIDSNSEITTETVAIGDAGDIFVRASSILINGGRFSSSALGEGNGGRINFDTDTLALVNGAQLLADTRGQGNAGSVGINASNSVQLIGSSTDGITFIRLPNSSVLRTPGARRFSGIFTSTTSADFKGGDIKITTPRLAVLEGATIDASTFSQGTAGNIDIDVSRLDLRDGGRIFSAAVGNGRAGAVTINSAEQVTMLGQTLFVSDVRAAIPNGNTLGETLPTITPDSGIFVRASINGIAGDIKITTPILYLDDQARLNAESTSGNGGNILLNVSNLLIVRHGSQVSTSVGMAQAGGNGGNITINAPTFHLDTQGQVSAESASGNGGNIILNVPTLLLLRRGSTISTTAGTAQAGGDGGNITINAPTGFIVGVKRENSDITANAFTGSGGRVNITAQGIYGLQFRPQLTPFSDITASSTFGISGTVTLDTPDIDPSQGLQELPVNLVDPARLIVQTCPRGAGSREIGTFVVTGRGSLPPNPTDLFPGSLSAKPLATLDESTPQTNSHQPPAAQPNSAVPTPIVEAQRIVKTANGEIFLVADAPTSAVPGSPAILDCP